MRLVLLHGHGSSPTELSEVADVLRTCGVEVECPPGPIELGNGTRAWFADPFAEPELGCDRSASAAVVELGKRVDLAGAVVCGFSQGGAMAVAAGFGRSDLKGVVSVCGFLPEGVNVSGSTNPMLLVAGDADEVVDPFYSESLARLAKKAGCSVTLATVSSGHRWTPEVSAVVTKWLRGLG